MAPAGSYVQSLKGSAINWESWENVSDIRQVWSWNFEAEFVELLAAASSGGTRLLAIDVEFPGFLREEPRHATREQKYRVLRDNVDNLKPIQLGAAIASDDGTLIGAWSFNFQFDPRYDLHSPTSLQFLCEAGVDFARHSTEGVSHELFGKRLAKSPLVRSLDLCWVVFSGFYDWGYILKLVSGQALPYTVTDFDLACQQLCPRCFDLRLAMPRGSLTDLAAKHGLWHRGFAHTGGSDALLTLELLFHAVTPSERRAAFATGASMYQADTSSWKSSMVESSFTDGSTTAEGSESSARSSASDYSTMAVPQSHVQALSTSGYSYSDSMEAWNSSWGDNSNSHQWWSEWDDWQTPITYRGKGKGKGGRFASRYDSRYYEEQNHYGWMTAVW